MGNATRNQSIFIVASILFLLAYEVLPKKQHALIPVNIEKTSLYTDQSIGGTSVVNWLDQGKSWKCELKKINNAGFCGITISNDWSHLITTDLSSYDKVIVELEASPALEHVTMSLRNYVPGVSTPGQVETYKYVSGAISKDELNRTLKIELREFRVAEWWIEQFKIPRKHQIPTYDQVSSIAFDIDRLNPPGTHTLHIKSATFVGDLVSRASWYLCAVSFWLAMSFSQLVMTALKTHKKLSHDRAMITKMTAIQNSLLDQSAEFEKRSTIDPLTQVLNRYGFEQVMEDLNESGIDDAQAVILLVDIDHFKKINDKNGHATGDKVIAHIAYMLRKHVRDLDSVVRWGGEEFLLFIPNCPIGKGKAIAEKICIAIATTDIEDLPSEHVTVSIGVSSFNISESFERAFEIADKALYQAKRKGRNQVCFPEA